MTSASRCFCRLDRQLRGVSALAIVAITSVCSGTVPQATAQVGPLASALPTTLSPSTGSTFYVSRRGSDANPGTLRRPWRTAQKALNTLRPGQQALVRAGTYSEGLLMRRSGTEAKPITLAAYPGERPVLRPASTDGDTYAMRISGSYFRLRGFVLEGAAGTSSANIYLFGSASHVDIRRNEIRASQDQGVFAEETTRSVHMVGNRIHGNGLNSDPGQHQSHGIYLQGQDHLIANNVIYDHPFGFGIQIYPENTGTIVVDNTVVASGLSGIVIGGEGGVTRITIRNNIFAFNSRWGIAHDSDNPSSSVADHNVLFGNGRGAIQPGFQGTDFSRGNINSDPRFVNVTMGDLHLQARSPALARALPDYSMRVDADGRRRPRGSGPDIGAFESSRATPARSRSG